MGKIALNAGDFAARSPDENAARRFLEARRWNGAPVCPRCGSGERMHRQSRDGVEGYFRCPRCRMVFTVRSGTLLERSHVPLAKWLFAMHLLASSRRDCSSVRLARLLAVTQKTAWSMLQRLRALSGEAGGEGGEDANGFLRTLITSGSNWRNDGER